MSDGWINRTHVGDCRALLGQMAADGVKAQTCVCSPPYFGLRDYGVEGQIGLERTPAEYVAALVDVFRAVREVLADDGTLWLNLGDSYANGGSTRNPGEKSTLQGNGHIGGGPKLKSMRRIARPVPDGFKPKDLLGIPWRVAFALQADGWFVRSDIIWHKTAVMPESVTDRPTRSHEHVFLLAKSERYHYDAKAIAEPARWAGTTGRPGGPKAAPARAMGKRPSGNELSGERVMVGETRNCRDVWTLGPEPFQGGHAACFPRTLAARCILAGSRPADTVLDCFMGSGTTAQVATDLGRHFIGCELNSSYVEELHPMRATTIGMPL